MTSPSPVPPLVIIAPRGKLIGLGVVCALFAAMGVVIVALSPTTTLNLIVGIAAIGFFGVGGGIAVVTQWRRSVILRADADGLRFPGVGAVPWADVDRVGVAGRLLGVRLRRYDSLLATAPAVYSAAALRATRATSAGYDLTWPANLLDRPPDEAAAAIRARKP